MKYAHHIAADFGMPCRNDSERRAVFDRLVSMSSWINKGECPKSSRWFSWTEACNSQLQEFWGSRLVLEAYLNVHYDMTVVEESSNFKEMRSSGSGGLLLAYKCLTQRTWSDASMLLKVQKVLWSSYTEHSQNVKSPPDEVKYCQYMVDNWMSGDLTSIVMLLSNGGFDDVLVRTELEEDIAGKIWDYTCRVIANRASSLSKHASPPYCYAHLVSPPHDVSFRSAMTQMRRDWKGLLALELSQVDDGGLAEDLRICVDSPTRIVMQAYEVCGWSQSDDANLMLKSMIQKIPDSKIIEDLHQRLRVKTKKRAMEKVTLGCCQHMVNTSKVIESRGVKNPSVINRYVFFNRIRSIKSQFNARKVMRSRMHKLLRKLLEG